MNGGHFDYKQYMFDDIVSKIERLIRDNKSTETDEHGEVIGTFFSQEVLDRFREAVYFLKKVKIYVHRIDYLVSCDDGEETFLEELDVDLNKFKRER